MLPHGVANRLGRARLQRRLCEEAAEITREQVATAALRELGIAGAVEKNRGGPALGGVPRNQLIRAPDQCLRALEHDVAIPKTRGKTANGRDAVALNFRAGHAQHPRGLTGVRRDDAQRGGGRRTRGQPVERAGVRDHGAVEIVPDFGNQFAQIAREFFIRESGADHDGGVIVQFHEARAARMHHHILQLHRHGRENILGGEQRDQARHRARRGARGEHRRPVITEAPRENADVPERALVPRDGTARRKRREVGGLRPVQIAVQPARKQAEVRGDFEPPDKRRRARLHQTDFRRAQRERDRGVERRAEHFAGVGIHAGGNVDGEDGKAGFIERGEQRDPLGVQRTIQADAENAVDQQRGFRRGLRGGIGLNLPEKNFAGRPRIEH